MNNAKPALSKGTCEFIDFTCQACGLIGGPHFALAFNIGYQLEAERDLIHRTCFVLRNLHIATVRGIRIPAMGTFKLDPVETWPRGTGTGPFWLFTRDEMATGDV